MAYTPTEWKSGDVITAEKLNNIEDGVQEALENSESGGERFEVVYDAINSTINHTFTEIQDAYLAGKTITARIYDTLQGVGESVAHPIEFVTSVMAVSRTGEGESIITFDFSVFELNSYPSSEPLHVRVLRVAGYSPTPIYTKKTIQLN